MSLFPQYNKTASIHRLQETSGKRDWNDTGNTAQVFLQPAAAEDALMYDGDVSTSFKAYATASNMLQTDRLIIEGETYEIRSIQKYDFGTEKHYKLFIQKQK